MRRNFTLRVWQPYYGVGYSPLYIYYELLIIFKKLHSIASNPFKIIMEQWKWTTRMQMYLSRGQETGSLFGVGLQQIFDLFGYSLRFWYSGIRIILCTVGCNLV